MANTNRAFSGSCPLVFTNRFGEVRKQTSGSYRMVEYQDDAESIREYFKLKEGERMVAGIKVPKKKPAPTGW